MTIILIILIIASFFLFLAKMKEDTKSQSFWQNLLSVIFIKVTDYFCKGTPTKVMMAFLRLATAMYSIMAIGYPLARAGFMCDQKKGYWAAFIELQTDSVSVTTTIVFLVIVALVVTVYFITHKNESKYEEFFQRYFSWLVKLDNKIDTIINALGSIQKQLDEINRNQELERLFPFRTFQQFARVYKDHEVNGYAETDELIKIKELLSTIKSTGNHYRFLALSGSGKTYTILQAFLNSEDKDNIFYCDTVNDAKFKPALDYLSQQHPGCIVILDNCPSEKSDFVIENYHNQLHVISAYFDPIDRDKASMQLTIGGESANEVIEKIILDNAVNPVPQSQKDFIIYHSGGIPLMALLLVKAFNANGVYSDIHDNVLMEHLLDISGANKNEQRIAMRTIALFQPLDYNRGASAHAEYLMKNDYFSPFEIAVSRKTIFNKVVDKLYRRSLIEKDANYINMRPQPLACWLVGEWLREQGGAIEDILADLKSKGRDFYDPLIEAWAKRLEFMQGNKDAISLYEELVNLHGGPFAKEDIVCSDLGSRLILAMATVNPVAVVNCLYGILFTKDVEWLRLNLVQTARRNIVRTLEKLCFHHDTFHVAACLMAKLALAENEDWANNAKGQFPQLFHIALAGTECNLNARIDVIRRLQSTEDDYSALLLMAIKGAFAHHNLHRMGGAEKFGFIELKDYTPKWSEIFEYWDNLYDILIEWLDDKPSDLPAISAIISTNARMMFSAGKSDLLFKFIESIAPRLNNNWPEMHKALIDIRNYDNISDTETKEIGRWEIELQPKDVIARMKNAVHDLYTRSRNGAEIMDKEESVVLPYVEEFIRDKGFLTDSVYSLLDRNNGYVSWAFDLNLAKMMTNEDVEAFCAFIKNYLLSREKDFYSSFLVSLISRSENKRIYWSLIDCLYENGYYDLSVPMMAVSDDDKHYLKYVMEETRCGNLSGYYSRRYLSSIRLTDADEILSMSELLQQLGADSQLIFDHIGHYWFEDGIYTHERLMVLFKSSILNYPLSVDKYYNHDFNLIVKALLEKTSDFEFAKKLNQKLVDFLSNNQSLYHVEELYNVLLSEKYRAYIWDNFSQALVDFDNKPAFAFNVRYTIGSGFDFGEKVLFTGHEDDMKQLCCDYPYGAFICAAMCPVFAEANRDSGQIEQFHPFVIWLIQNYGSQQIVLDEFHSNMGTFHWEGSSIPLYEDRKRCFEHLRSIPHLPSNVYSWIDLCLKDNADDLDRENNNEAFMRLAYRK